ncbi:TetR family transcriptional regulator [Geodermatophilus aquaeductus]|uniref:Transcriptional regulator, TetR family n=1 Tax=Geodermatophilus aquaeductus TaxID=1564161 RepID=A0A521FEI1_9ACTN|nr:TetR family transcriptional regulator [Geodermatophilus aquaeductus]SMO94071.1 transcriptional regulator, TetR family [Geodermatophilus aquaeductus]
MTAAGTEHVSRDERRRRTEAAILEAARALFAETGFERATIRAVAASAGVDPALVMQYFGSKDNLFAAATRWSREHVSVLDAPRSQVPAAAIADLFETFEGPGGREGAAALMRNCLTHPEANRTLRDDVMCSVASGVAETIGGEDAELRAGLMAACIMGLGLSRYLLQIPAVATASRADVERLLEPALCALLDAPERPAG